MLFIQLIVSTTIYYHGMSAKTQQQQHQQHVIYVEPRNGTKEGSCWTGGLELPCESLELALKGAEYFKDSVITILSPAELIDQRNSSPGLLNDCPTWMHPTNEYNKCVCGSNHHHTVRCNSTLNQIYILDCYQMTFDDELQQVVAGPSFYGCEYNHHDTNDVYRPVPTNRSRINEVMCGPFNRSGRLCGACKDGYSPLVYSYNLCCKQCSKSESKYNWAKFTAVAFIPLTIFYTLVLLLQFNANSPSLHGFVIVAQMISTPALVRICMSISNKRIKYATKVVATLYGFWNLDFFRAFSPDICLNISTLQALTLDYVLAFYPLLLIFLTYITIKLYSRDCKVIVCLWRVFQRSCLYFKQNQNKKSSIIDVFATFLLLSYNKILTVSLDLLSFTVPVNSTGHSTGKYLFYDATYKYFGTDHLPYGVLASLIFTCFNLAPFLLLLLYPMKWFQKFLNYTTLNHIVLHTFVDSFAGCYKDGTEPGTRDCRYFAALFLLLRILVCISYEVTFNVYFFGLCGTIFALFTIAIIVAQPYKSKHAKYNIITQTMFVIITLSLFSFINVNIALIKMYQAVKFSVVIAAIVIALPQFYIISITLMWVSKLKICRKCIHYWRKTSSQSSNESSLLTATGDHSLFQYQSMQAKAY